MRYIVYAISLLLLAGALIPVSLLLTGWIFGHADHIERAKDIAAVISPALTLIGLGVAAFVAYNTWLSPFRAVVQARPFFWRLGPGTPPSCPVNIVVYLTLFNVGVISGVVSDFLLEIELPKGKWIFEPMFFAKSTEFYQELLRPETTVSFQSEIVEGPFTPIFLPGRTQETRVVSFCPGIGTNDFNLDLIAPGRHPLRLFARYDLADELTQIIDAKIIFEPDVLAEWKAGKTVAGEVRHRDRNIKELPRK